MTRQSPYAELLAPIPVEEHQISVLGSDTHYWVYGPADATTTIIIAHGYRGEHHGLEPVIGYLPDIRWISPDMPGFGDSTPLTEAKHSVAGYADWLVAFIDALDLTDAVVLGHSFGSIISSQAVANGMRPPALILVNPIAISGLDGPHQAATKFTVWFYRTARRMPTRVGEWVLGHWIVTQFVSSTMTRTKNKELRRWIHDQHHTYFSRFASLDVVVESFEASISKNVSDFAAEMPVPTLLVAAEFDDVTPIDAVRGLVEKMPDATLAEMKDVGHLIHYEVPAAAAAAIREFLDDRLPKGSLPE